MCVCVCLCYPSSFPHDLTFADDPDDPTHLASVSAPAAVAPVTGPPPCFHSDAPSPAVALPCLVLPPAWVLPEPQLSGHRGPHPSPSLFHSEAPSPAFALPSLVLPPASFVPQPQLPALFTKFQWHCFGIKSMFLSMPPRPQSPHFSIPKDTNMIEKMVLFRRSEV